MLHNVATARPMPPAWMALMSVSAALVTTRHRPFTSTNRLLTAPTRTKRAAVERPVMGLQGTHNNRKRTALKKILISIKRLKAPPK